MIRPPPIPPLFPPPPLSLFLRFCARPSDAPAALLEIVAKEGIEGPQRARIGAHAMAAAVNVQDRKSTRLNSSHSQISYAVFCLKKKKKLPHTARVDASAHTL